ncbi:MAG: tyrosine-type recombinase/integrase [Oscillospiraceae bacterium]|nr:tyrosine-type recombinase/integrase [Oscillospiraceae bacterium]
MNNYLTKCFNLYCDNLSSDLSENTVYNKSYYVQCFLETLDDDFHDFKNFDFNFVYRYINSLDYASQTISGIEFVLRDFFNVLYENNLSNFDGKKIFPVIITNKRDTIPSYYSPEEVKKIIDSIDISKPHGVEHKCMLLLEAQMGLRTSDILGLKFNEILWDKNLIYKTQHKTGNPVSVHMPENLKFLLIDYLKNYRPSSKENYVFICEKTKSQYSPGTLYYIFNKYLKKADITVGNRKHGPHTLRHSLASNLLRNDTPTQVITGILGHKNLNMTSRYLSIDIETLRSLCLEVSIDDE